MTRLIGSDTKTLTERYALIVHRISVIENNQKTNQLTWFETKDLENLKQSLKEVKLKLLLKGVTLE